MIERAIAITACQLELSQTQQRILGLWSERVIHNYVLVVALGVRGIGSQRRAPEQSLGI
jgi:hypothetical protein